MRHSKIATVWYVVCMVIVFVAFVQETTFASDKPEKFEVRYMIIRAENTAETQDNRSEKFKTLLENKYPVKITDMAEDFLNALKVDYPDYGFEVLQYGKVTCLDQESCQINGDSKLDKKYGASLIDAISLIAKPGNKVFIRVKGSFQVPDKSGYASVGWETPKDVGNLYNYEQTYCQVGYTNTLGISYYYLLSVKPIY